MPCSIMVTLLDCGEVESDRGCGEALSSRDGPKGGETMIRVSEVCGSKDSRAIGSKEVW